MFPLNQRKLIRGCQAHIKAGLGCGADYIAVYEPFVIPFNGTVETYWGNQGGNWLRLIRDDNGDKIELAHLASYAIKSGKAKAGQRGGITGNTGQVTTGPHLHIQIINKQGKRLDPESYNWETPQPTPMPIKFPVPLITTQAWTAPQIEEARQMILQASDNRLDIQVSVTQKTFPSIPFTGGMVDQEWYRQNISPAIAFHMSVAEWQSLDGGWHTEDGIQFRADQNEVIYNPQTGNTVRAFVQNFVHELCHRFYFITGQPDITHQFMLTPAGIFNPKGAYSQLDYSKLKKGDNLKLVKDSGTVYIVSGNSNKVKIGIADAESLALFGDEPIANESTAGIPQTMTISKGFIINKK